MKELEVASEVLTGSKLPFLVPACVPVYLDRRVVFCLFGDGFKPKVEYRLKILESMQRRYTFKTVISTKQVSYRCIKDYVLFVRYTIDIYSHMIVIIWILPLLTIHNAEKQFFLLKPYLSLPSIASLFKIWHLIYWPTLLLPCMQHTSPWLFRKYLALLKTSSERTVMDLLGKINSRACWPLGQVYYWQ